MSSSTLLSLHGEIPSFASADFSNRGELVFGADSFLAEHNSMSQPSPIPVVRYVDHTLYVVYEKSGLDNSFISGLHEWQREGYIWPPPVLHDRDTRGVTTAKAPFSHFRGNSHRNDKGPLLSLLEYLDGDAGEALESMRQGTTKLVIKSEHENVNWASYWIYPDLLGKVLDRLPNLNTIGVGSIGVECPTKQAPGFRPQRRLETLEVCWEELEWGCNNTICPDGRDDYASFRDLLAMFTHVDNLRFVNTAVPWSRWAYDHCGAHELVNVRAVYLTPPEPTGSELDVILRFLRQSLELSALEKLVVDDLCQAFPGDINAFLSRAVNLSSVSLSFQHPTEGKNIKPTLIDVSVLRQLQDLTLDISVRPNPDPQSEWAKAIGTLQSAASTPIKSITLRLTTRLIPPEDYMERQAWRNRPAADVAVDFSSATWPPFAWNAVRKALQRGFRGLRIECRGPLRWAEEERARAQAVLGAKLSEFIILDSSSLKA